MSELRLTINHFATATQPIERIVTLGKLLRVSELVIIGGLFSVFIAILGMLCPLHEALQNSGVPSAQALNVPYIALAAIVQHKALLASFKIGQTYLN